MKITHLHSDSVADLNTLFCLFENPHRATTNGVTLGQGLSVCPANHRQGGCLGNIFAFLFLAANFAEIIVNLLTVFFSVAFLQNVTVKITDIFFNIIYVIYSYFGADLATC